MGKRFLDNGILLERACELVNRRNRYPKPVFEYSPDSPSPQPYDVPYGTVLIPNPHTPRDREGRRITQMVPKKPDPAQPKQIDMKNEKPTESKQTTTISVHDDQEGKTMSRDGMKEAEEPRREGTHTLRPPPQPMDTSPSPEPSPPPPTRRRQLNKFSDDEPEDQKNVSARYKSPSAKRRRSQEKEDNGRMAKSKSLSDLVELDEDVMSVRTYEDEDVLEERPKLRARLGNKWEDEPSPIIIERANIRERLAHKMKKEEAPIVIPPVKSTLVSRAITVSSRKASKPEESSSESTESESESESESEKEDAKSTESNIVKSPSWDMFRRRKVSDNSGPEVEKEESKDKERQPGPAARKESFLEERSSIRARLANRMKGEDSGEVKIDPKRDSWFKTLKQKARSKRQSVEKIEKVDKRKSVEQLEKLNEDKRKSIEKMEKLDTKKSIEKLEKLDKKKSTEKLDKLDKKKSSEKLDRLDKDRKKSESGDSTGEPHEEDDSSMSRGESGRFSLRKGRPQNSSSSFHEYAPVERRVPLKERLKTQETEDEESENKVTSSDTGKDSLRSRFMRRFGMGNDERMTDIKEGDEKKNGKKVDDFFSWKRKEEEEEESDDEESEEDSEDDSDEEERKKKQEDEWTRYEVIKKEEEEKKKKEERKRKEEKAREEERKKKQEEIRARAQEEDDQASDMVVKRVWKAAKGGMVEEVSEEHKKGREVTKSRKPWINEDVIIP